MSISKKFNICFSSLSSDELTEFKDRIVKEENLIKKIRDHKKIYLHTELKVLFAQTKYEIISEKYKLKTSELIDFATKNINNIVKPVAVKSRETYYPIGLKFDYIDNPDIKKYHDEWHKLSKMETKFYLLIRLHSDIIINFKKSLKSIIYKIVIDDLN